MGWITNKRLKSGQGLASGHKKTRRMGAPLRNITERIYAGEGMFGRDRVRLECGHEVFSNATHKARCIHCLNKISNE